MIPLLTSLVILLGLFLIGTIQQIAGQAQENAALRRSYERTLRQLDDAYDELVELRNEYERSLGVERKHKPVNRVFGRKR